MSWNLIAPFLTDDPAFARGVRYGMLYMRLSRARRNQVVEMVSEEDEERVRLMAHRLGWRVANRKSNGDWIRMVFIKECS